MSTLLSIPLSTPKAPPTEAWTALTPRASRLMANSPHHAMVIAAKWVAGVIKEECGGSIGHDRPGHAQWGTSPMCWWSHRRWIRWSRARPMEEAAVCHQFAHWQWKLYRSWSSREITIERVIVLIDQDRRVKRQQKTASWGENRRYVCDTDSWVEAQQRRGEGQEERRGGEKQPEKLARLLHHG